MKNKKNNIIALSLAMTMIASVPISIFAQNTNSGVTRIVAASEVGVKSVTPIPKDIVVFKGDELKAQDGIKNIAELSEFSSATFDGKYNSNSVGESKVEILVNYKQVASDHITTNLKVFDSENLSETLNSLIEEAKNLKAEVVESENGDSVEVGKKWAKKAEISAFDTAINKAETLKNGKDQQTLKQAILNLYSAKDTFNSVIQIRRARVNFNSNGQNIKVLEVNESNKVQEFTPEDRTGYKFKGWFEDLSSTNKFNFSSSVTTDKTLYAKWIEECTVTFDAKGGNVVPPAIKVEKGEKIQTFPNPTKQGYTFGGWYTDQNAIEYKFDFNGRPITNNITLYANWIKNEPTPITKYTVTYKVNGDFYTSEKIDSGRSANNLNPKYKSGYTFDGWYTDSSYKTKYYFSKSVSSDLILYGRYVENKKETLRIIQDKYENGYFYGYVRDSDGDRVRNAKVTLYDYDGSYIKSEDTDYSGAFKIYIGYSYGYNGNRDYYNGYRVYYDSYRNEYYYYDSYNNRKNIEGWNSSYYSNRYYLKAYKENYYESEKYYLNGYNRSDYYNEKRVYPTSIQRGSYTVNGYVNSYPNRTIEVRDGSTYLGRTTTNSYGYFSLSWNSPYISTNKVLDYYIIGESKNSSKSPEISEAVAGTKVIKGIAGAYAKVEAIDSRNNKLGETTADYKGNYTINLNRELKPSERITMKATESSKSTASQDYIIGTKMASNKETVYRKAYILGYPDGTFRPQGKVTRAEAAQMFGSLLNGSTNFGTDRNTKFRDANNDWFSPAINYAVSKGLISGYEDGTFRPNQNITRAEFAQMISGYVREGYPGSSSFKDVKGHWASDAIDAVYGNKAIKGYPDGTFKPNQDITRAEAVTILNAVFGRNSKKESFKNISTNKLTTFRDVSSDFWAYYEILDASNSHTSEKVKDSTEVEVWK